MITDQTVLAAGVFLLYSLAALMLAGSVSTLVDAWKSAWRD